MRAADVMTREVATVTPDTPLTEVADLLLDRRISGVPVVDATGRLVGVLSEADLMWRAEEGEHRRSWWASLFAGRPLAAADFIRTHGTRARDVMTTDVVSVKEDTPLEEVLELFDRRRIKRVPVVRDGRLAGIVSRSDLLRALAKRRSDVAGPSDDRSLGERLHQLIDEQRWLDPGLVNVHVSNGVAQISGLVQSETERRALHVAAMSIPGITQVEDSLTIGRPTTGAY